MNTLKNFINYILIGITIIGFIITLGVSKANTFNNYFFGIGLFLCASGSILLWRNFKIESDEIESDFQKRLNELKNSGDKIEVNLTECEVKSNSWTTSEERTYDSRIQFWNTVGGDADLNVSKVNHHSTYIIFKTTYNSFNHEFIGIVSKDEITVMMLLEHQGKTYIYVDKADPSYYYFDLEFLRN